LPKENFPSLPLLTTPCFNHEPDFNTISERSPPTAESLCVVLDFTALKAIYQPEEYLVPVIKILYFMAFYFNHKEKNVILKSWDLRAFTTSSIPMALRQCSTFCARQRRSTFYKIASSKATNISTASVSPKTASKPPSLSLSFLLLIYLSYTVVSMVGHCSF
jgi:hypothetical protein